MATKEELEVYRQRCESYRFHYKLEWQFLQVGVAIGLVTLGLGEQAFNPQWWQFIIGGGVFLGFSYAMQRVARAITDSRPSFVCYARLVGDDRVQEIGSWQKSAAVWGRIILHSTGVILIVCGICKVDAIARWLEVLLIDLMLIWLTGWTAWQPLSNKSKSAIEILWIVCVILFPIAIIMWLDWYYAGI